MPAQQHSPEVRHRPTPQHVVGRTRVVQFMADDGLRLSGLMTDVGSDTTVVHVHGKGGNFYENKFLDVMRSVYAAGGLNFLTFNNRGHSTLVEAYRNGELTYVGAAVEDFEDCLLDIGAAVRYAKTMGSRVLLQGHCFGGDKIMHYSRSVDDETDLILLSPCDAYRVHAAYIYPERVEDQLTRLRASYRLEGMEWLPETEHGVNVAGASYPLPVIASAFVKLLAGPAFELLRADLPWRGPRIANRTFVYLGGRDPLQLDGIAAIRRVLDSRFSSASVVIFRGGGHQLKPIQHEVAAAIVDWIGQPQPQARLASRSRVKGLGSAATDPQRRERRARPTGVR